MGNTKDEILTAALRLFAADGYEAVSVSRIAAELGMTKGALYKHYRNKRDIFDSILSAMEARDGEQAENYDMPAGTADEMEEAYEEASLDRFVEYCRAQFDYWTEDDFAASFRRMLTLEQFRNAEMQRLYQQYLAAGPAGYVADLFRSMRIEGWERQAFCLYSLMFMFYSIYDGAEDKASARELFIRILDDFAAGLEYEP